MQDKIVASLDTLTLGAKAVISGVRVVRRSLLGFQVASAEDLVDAREAAKRIGVLAKCRAVRVAICERCGGDGLGRRNRGVCGLCRGPGIQVVPPLLGWVETSAEDLTSGLEQATAALQSARYPKARASLIALLNEMLSCASSAVQQRFVSELRQWGFGGQFASSSAQNEDTQAA